MQRLFKGMYVIRKKWLNVVLFHVIYSLCILFVRLLVLFFFFQLGLSDCVSRLISMLRTAAE